MKFILFSFIILTLFSQSSNAWDFKDFKDEISVPINTDAKYGLLIGGAVTASLLVFQDGVVKPFQKHTVEEKPLGESSKWGDWMGQWIPNAVYMGAMAISGYYGDPQGRRRAIGMFKASTYSSGVTTVLKYTVREPRPIDHNWRNSFPSGHTTTAFAFCGYVMAEHEYLIGVPALLLSTFVGYSRINDNMHWLHDVTAGATIGWVYGWGISRLQQKNNDSVYVVPIYDNQTVGLALYKDF